MSITPTENYCVSTSGSEFKKKMKLEKRNLKKELEINDLEDSLTVVNLFPGKKGRSTLDVKNVPPKKSSKTKINVPPISKVRSTLENRIPEGSKKPAKSSVKTEKLVNCRDNNRLWSSRAKRPFMCGDVSHKSSNSKLTRKKNGEIERLLCNRDEEINELKALIETLKGSLNNSNEQQFERSKIITLSKRNRQLKAELEAFKSKYEKEQNKMATLESQVKKLTKHLEEKETEDTKKDSPNLVNQLQDQLQSTKQKLFESLNQITELRNNLKLAQKCIQQEIGENINLAVLAAANSNWRGRAQQISALRNKVSELRAKIENPTASSNAHIRTESDSNKRMEIDRLTEQLNDVKIELENSKSKMSALKVRNQNLADGVTKYKLKTLHLMEEVGLANEAKAILNENMNIQKYQYENKINNLIKQIEEVEKSKNEEKIKHSETKLDLENSQIIIKNNQNTIRQLNDKIRKVEEDMRNICGDFLFSCRDFKKEEFLTILQSLESEKSRLIECNKTFSERLANDRERVTELSETISKQKIQIARLESKIAELQKELDKKEEKKKRSQRIADYSNNLNGRLASIVIENSNSQTSPFQTSLISASSINLQYEDLENRIQLVNEKNSLLQEELNLVSKEKENDFKAFNDVISNSKNIVLNMILKAKENEAKQRPTTDNSTQTIVCAEDDDIESDPDL